MARFECLLCATCFDPPANHSCARECLPAADRHLDFCRECAAACLREFEPQMVESPVRDAGEDRRER
jgi:hypothetical protein